MKLSTLWSAYKGVLARKVMLVGMRPVSREHEAILLSAVAHRVRQADKLEKAIGRRIAALEAGAGGK
jgi:hypothetical protein